MPSTKYITTASFRTTEAISALAEKIAKKHGQSKSAFLSGQVLDKAMDFERVRHMDTISDFCSIALPYIETQDGLDKDIADKLIQKLKRVQTSYCQQRLNAQLTLQRHLTNVAINCYLQDYTETYDGTDGFIVQQSLMTIYDTLLSYDLISRAEWEEQCAAYALYMEETGTNLLHPKD